jgi:hypothetical protein
MVCGTTGTGSRIRIVVLVISACVILIVRAPEFELMLFRAASLQGYVYR